MCSEDNNMEQIKAKVHKFCTANNGKGYIGLYFTKKELHQMKQFGITQDMTIQEAFERIK